MNFSYCIDFVKLNIPQSILSNYFYDNRILNKPDYSDDIGSMIHFKEVFESTPDGFNSLHDFYTYNVMYYDRYDYGVDHKRVNTGSYFYSNSYAFSAKNYLSSMSNANANNSALSNASSNNYIRLDETRLDNISAAFEGSLNCSDELSTYIPAVIGFRHLVVIF